MGSTGRTTEQLEEVYDKMDAEGLDNSERPQVWVDGVYDGLNHLEALHAQCDRYYILDNIAEVYGLRTLASLGPNLMVMLEKGLIEINVTEKGRQVEWESQLKSQNHN